MPTSPLNGHVALVIGANHGIGAATAVALARLGAAVGITYLRQSPGDDDPGRPAAYAEQRAREAGSVVAAASAAASTAFAVDADLSGYRSGGQDSRHIRVSVAVAS